MNIHDEVWDLFNHFHAMNSIDGAHENMDRFLSFPSVGIVINTDDPLQQGRVQVFCPAFGDNPKKLLHLPWCAYVSPFIGSIKNSCFTRGVMDGPEKTEGAVQYGFWAIPELGSHAVVSCLDGDARRRIYMGSLPEHQENNTLHHGKFVWGEGGIPNGPLSSDGSPIEPIYTNVGEAFKQDRESREWRSRIADYQVSAIRKDIGEVPNETKEDYLDQQYDEISEAEPDGWVKPKLGSHGYDWTSFKNMGEMMASKVFGFSSPGFHAFTLDDRPFNSRGKWRSATGHMILLDDTNERIYIMTNKGKSWVEMDSSGNIDIYSDRRISMNAKKGFNFTTDDTFRVHAKKGIHLYSGNNISQSDLDNPPEDGEIRIQAENDLHLITNNVLRVYSYSDSLFEIGGKKCESIGDSSYLHVENDIHTITNKGSYYLTISSDINEIVNGNVKRYALGNQAYAADGNFESFSFGGRMDIGSQRLLNVKSIAEDITFESMGNNTSNSGGLFIKTPKSQYGISHKGIFWATKEKVRGRSEGDTDIEVGETSIQDRPLPPQDIGDCAIGDSVDTTGLSGADLAAAAAYNAGFRGDALVTAVAISKGESGYNPGAVGDESLVNSKWGPSHGLWQVRTLNNPENYGDYRGDNQRVGDGRLFNPNTNAQAAFAISNNGVDFSPWSVYTSGDYLNNMDEARAAVASMCGTPPVEMSFTELYSLNFPGIVGCPGQDIKSIVEGFLENCLNSTKTILKIKTSKMILKAVDDIEYKLDTDLIGTSVKNMFGKITDLIGLSDSIGAFLEISMPAISSAISVLGGSLDLPSIPTGWLDILGALGGGLEDFFKPVSALLDLFDDIDSSVCSVPNLDIPFFNSVSQEIFYYQNHDTINC